MEFVTPVRDLAVRAGAYAMASAIADGMDFFDVHEKAGAAVARARAGEGPRLLECKTEAPAALTDAIRAQLEAG